MGTLLWLFLAYNLIKDISPVEGLENLHGLYIGGNPVQDYATLESLEIDELDFHAEPLELYAQDAPEELVELELLGDYGGL